MHRYQHKAMCMTKKKSRKHDNTKAKEWFYILEALKEKKLSAKKPEKPEKLFSRNEGKIKTLQDKNQS